MGSPHVGLVDRALSRVTLALACAAAAGALLTGLAGAGATALAAPASASQQQGVVDIETILANGGGTTAGTGIVLPSKPGVVLTNNHVIAGARRIVAIDVTTGRRRGATVVGYDVADDVAVLRLAGSPNLTAATLGDSSGVKVGDAITAVGNAGGVGGTPDAASGSVTALHQTITVSDESGGLARLTNLIEVAADLEPGDSGGPLLDSSGRVVGVNTAATAGVGSEGTGDGPGYAIPINVAARIADRILAGRASARIHIGATARLGVQVVSAARLPGRTATPGAAVAGVVAGTPAARAGLGAGDVITSLGGRRVRSAAALITAMLVHHPHDVVRVVWTDVAGARHAASVRLVAGAPA